MTNADPAELQKFSSLAERWWDPSGEFKPLHEINPLRIDYIAQRTRLPGSHHLDVGCGGGLITESLARLGAKVTGIDLSEKALAVARLHAEESALAINYRLISTEELAASEPGHYDSVSCLEMLEHVPEPSAIVAGCAQLVKPGGSVFFSTLNRHPKAYLFAVLGAEYIMNLLPKGTHDYEKFIKPSELTRWCRNAGLEVCAVDGMSYLALQKQWVIDRDTRVNYLIHGKRPKE